MQSLRRAARSRAGLKRAENKDTFGPIGTPADASLRLQKWREDGREIGTEEKT
jgi:hypothetical protein